MIRALLPVTFALVLIVTAGILLAKNGVFGGSDNEFQRVSAASSSCGSCCSKDTVESIAITEAGSSCRREPAGIGTCCGEGACPSQAAFASLTTASEGEACSAGGCPFATASAEKSCSSGAKICNGDAREECLASDKPCSKKDDASCCSKEEEEPVLKDEGDGEVASEDSVATLAD